MTDHIRAFDYSVRWSDVRFVFLKVLVGISTSGGLSQFANEHMPVFFALFGAIGSLALLAVSFWVGWATVEAWARPRR